MFSFHKLTSLHFLIILLFFSVFLVLVYLPHSKPPKKPIVNVSILDTSLSINLSFYAQKNKLSDSLITLYLQHRISLDTLITIFNKNQLPQLAAYFDEIKHLSSTTDTIWFYLGKNYYNSLGFIHSASEAEPIIASAARCFNKAISLNPENTNAKIMLASCYVQSSAPMLGIQMLKQIEKTDSNNILLQMQLAEFSLRSHQLNKAIQHYQKALQLDTNRTEIYAYLSEIYLQKKDTLQSIHFLRKFAARVSDTLLKNSIEQYINQIYKP